MCGIAGIIGLFPERSEVLDTMLKVQAHRGPDGTGHWADEYIAFSPKRPLQTPQREWLAGDLRDYTESAIGLFSKSDFVIQSEVSKIWDSYLKGKNDNSFLSGNG